MKLFFKALTVSMAVMLMSLSGSAFAKDNSALSAKHRKIMKDFPAVKHISIAELQTLEPSEAIIFDIRESDEFQISHMANAILVSPKVSAKDFMRQYGAHVNGKTVILYCSVGQRSSILAEKVQGELSVSGANAVYNLEGGLFKWHNENLPLVSPSAETTDYIHPYNYFWGRMVNDKAKKLYKNEDK